VTQSEAPQGAVDRMIAARPELARSAIANWDGRHSSRFLKAVARLFALCPEACLDRIAWSDAPDYYPALIEKISSTAAWAHGVKSRGIKPGEEIDRTASMFGGAPWTCEKYPWPMGKQGQRPMSPLVQLNLATLELGAVERFPPVLVQVWGDAHRARTRTIPLSEIAGRTPFPLHSGLADTNLLSPSAFLPDMGNRNLYYDGRENSWDRLLQVGEYISVGRTSFHILGAGKEDYFLFSTEDLKIRDPKLLSRVEAAMKATREAGLELISREEKLGRRNHFGGTHSPVQRGYTPWQRSEKALLEVGSPDHGPALSILGSGRLQVTYDPNDLWSGYEAFASV
jgi:hypothetical protein